MKKYFVKYLPTHAEAKQGDLCFHPEYGLGRFNGRNPMGYIHWDAAWVLFGDRYPQSKRSEINFNEKCDSLKKAELVLCSGQLQVGDTAWSEELKRYDMIENESQLKQVEFLKGISVLGKISPLATWVKDFMEIDAADAKFYNKYNGTNYPPDLYYVIKCPTCGIFH